MSDAERTTGERKLSRKDLLRLAGAGGAGLTLGAGGYAAVRGVADARDAGDEGAGLPSLQTVAFHGKHQAGIATAQQEHLCFAALDLATEDVSEVRELLRAFSEAGARMVAGKPAGEDNESQFMPPEDTGEAFGLSPARLTLTFGFGPSLFAKSGDDRFGLAKARPEALAPLPPLTGDLGVQACADAPQVAFHEEKILRRGYSFTDGFDAELGQLDAGLFVICFQRDPRNQFVPLQRLRHTGSALFACPPCAREGDYVGESLFQESLPLGSGALTRRS